MIKISVIIPVYNTEKYLDECLQSLQTQTMQDAEFICIDDGSSDRSGEILRSWAGRDPRFVLIFQQNQGQGVARNRAIKTARGKYLAFVDSDDTMLPGALQELYDFAESRDAEAVRFNYRQVNDISGRIKNFSFARFVKHKYHYDLAKKTYYNWRDLKRECLTALDVHAWLYLFRTDFIRRNGIEFAPSRRGEDHLFTNGALLLAEKICYLDKIYYTYRDRPASTVNSCGSDNMEVFDNIDRMKNFILKHELWSELQEEFQNYRIKVLGWHYYQTPEELREEYETRCRRQLSPQEYQAMLKVVEKGSSFFEKIFSIRNRRKNGIKEKIITIFGFSFAFSR